MKLEADNRDYLDWNSFVDCSGIKEKSYKELENALQELPIKNIGTVSEADLVRIIDKIKTAKTIAPVVKRKYGFDQE